jgi:hypothetical protein
MVKANFVDSTTIHAIGSLFHRGNRDPWGSRLAGQLADLFIYSDLIRYPVPDRGQTGLYDLAHVDGLLGDLARRDSEAFNRAIYSTSVPRRLANEYLEECFRSFSAWARANRQTLERWLAFHHEDWIQVHRRETLPAGYTFLLDDLSRLGEPAKLSAELNIPNEDLCYAFDSILKFPLFGELAGSEAYYLNHEIRDAFQLPTMASELAIPPRCAVTFAESITSIVPHLSRDEYTVVLHELRNLVRQYGLHLVGPGEFDKEVIREIAAKAQLPPRVSALGRAAGLVGGAVGVLGALTPLASVMAVLGGAITISTTLWQGTVPRSIGRLKWLRWALVWDIERQAETRTK